MALLEPELLEPLELLELPQLATSRTMDAATASDRTTDTATLTRDFVLITASPLLCLAC